MRRLDSKFENVKKDDSERGGSKGESELELSEDEIQEKENLELKKQKSKRENGKIKVPDLAKLQKNKSMKAGSSSSLTAQFSNDLKLSKQNTKFVSQSSMKMPAKINDAEEPEKEELGMKLVEK